MIQKYILVGKAFIETALVFKIEMFI